MVIKHQSLVVVSIRSNIQTMVHCHLSIGNFILAQLIVTSLNWIQPLDDQYCTIQKTSLWYWEMIHEMVTKD